MFGVLAEKEYEVEVWGPSNVFILICLGLHKWKHM